MMKAANANTRRAISRVKDQMRGGSLLMVMHTTGDQKWFVVPGQEVDSNIAKRVIEEPDVLQQADGLFPGVSQTYKITSRPPHVGAA
jgi:hypothetical protein